jgi:hypothetical protein
MTRFDVVDGTRPDDPRFDPRGAQARRLRARAVARAEATASRPAGRGVLVGVALAVCVVAVLAGAASVLLTTSSPPGAGAALRQAAARTASFDSGRIIFTSRSAPRGGEPGYVSRDELRFDDGDFESVSRWGVVSRGGRTVSLGADTSLEIDGRGYSRDDSRPGAGFVPLGGPWGDGDFRKRLIDQVGSEALVALARRASDLTTEPAAGGGTVYRATATAGAVFDAAPLAAGRASGGGWKRKVRLAVTVDDDGVIRRVEVGSPQLTMTTTFVDLGERQLLERPPPDTRADGR